MKALANLESEARADERSASISSEDEPYRRGPRYRRALAGFSAHLADLQHVTAQPLPDGVLRALAAYLPDCWWKNFEEDRAES